MPKIIKAGDNVQVPPITPPIEGSGTASPEPTDYRLIKLIAVGLKEASMDTATFRASINYLDSEVHKIEKGIKDLLKVLSQFKHYQETLSHFSTVLKDTLNPPCTKSGLINNHNTLASLDATSLGLSSFYDTLLSLFTGDFDSLALEQILSKELANYYNIRSRFDYTQQKYDLFEAKYHSQSKTKSAPSVKDDAFQLFELRKQYIHISIELWISLIQLDIVISAEVSEVTYKLWGDNSHLPPSMTPDHRQAILNILGISEKFDIAKASHYFTRLQSQSFKGMMHDLISTGKESEKGANEMFTPSDDVSAYDPAVINNVNVYIDGPAPAKEKHGWVYMKSIPLGSNNTLPVDKDGFVWVRRWLFIADDLLGILSLSPNGKFVQESDKLGVLLCNIRYAPEEDRRFCFEIKTYQITLVFQAYSLAELRSWMTVFRSVKLNALNNPENEPLTSPARNRIPPLIEQFVLSPTVAKDVELVTREENSMIDIVSVMKYEFSESFHIDDFSSALNCINFRVPMHTEMTKYACYSYAFVSPTTVPNAITANTWGFINWGMYYLVNDVELGHLNINKGTEQNVSKGSGSISLNYKSLEEYFHDLEMKSIFQYAIKPNEYILFSYDCLWSPNENQELGMYIYVSQNKLYSVLYDYGFTSLRPMFLSSFLHCALEEKGVYSILRVYTINGVSLKFKVATIKGRVIKDKFNTCIKNLSSKSSKSLEALMEQLEKIDQVHSAVEKEAKAVAPLYPYDKLSQSIVTVPNDGRDQTDGFKAVEEMTFLASKVYKIPAKALFHIVAGDNSNLLSSMLPLRFFNSATRSLPWRCSSEQVLTRRVWYDAFPGYSTYQTVDKMEYNKYYSMKQETTKLIFPGSIIARIHVRMLIVSLDSKSTKLLIYYSLDREKERQYFKWFTEAIYDQIMSYKADTLLESCNMRVETILKDKRKVASSVKIYGPLTKYDSDEPTKEELDFAHSVIRVRLSSIIDFLIRKSGKELILDTASLMKFFKELMNTFLSFISKNYLFLSIMILSLVFNFMMVGKIGYDYWRVKSTERYVDRYVKEPKIMERAVYFKDVEVYLSKDSALSYNSSGSSCFQKFTKSSTAYKSLLSHVSPNEETLSSLRTSEDLFNPLLLEIGIKRNELLAQLDLVNKAELGLIAADWKDWVIYENKNCQEAQLEVANAKDFNSSDIDNEYSYLLDYCLSAQKELHHIYSSLI